MRIVVMVNAGELGCALSAGEIFIRQYESSPRIALLSQEGSVIAYFAMTRGVVPERNVSECILKGCGFGTSPRTISTAVSIVLPS